jgi:hypothetical protein
MDTNVGALMKLEAAVSGAIDVAAHSRAHHIPVLGVGLYLSQLWTSGFSKLLYISLEH